MATCAAAVPRKGSRFKCSNAVTGKPAWTATAPPGHHHACLGFPDLRMRFAHCLSSFAAILALLGSAHAAERGFIEASGDRPEAEQRPAEPAKAGSGVPGEAAETRPADKDVKRRPGTGFRIKLPAEIE
jgi:hypothetical protein